MPKGISPTIIYHQLIMEHSETGKKVYITQNEDNQFLAQIPDSDIWKTHNSIKQAINWAELKLQEVT